MTLSEDYLDLEWCRVHFRSTDMITDEVFVWVTDVRTPTKDEIRDALSRARRLQSCYFIYANVDSTNPTHMRFARHFGFREVRREGKISIQVWEKDKWARPFLH